MTGKYDDLVGQRFGALTVLKYSGKSERKKIQYLCKCDCGKEKHVERYNLLYGHTQNCGCQRTYNKRAGRAQEQLRTSTFLQMEDVLKQNVVIVDEDISQHKESLCNHCIRSAAPPSLQCIWDDSKAKLLPDGAKISASETKTVGSGGGKKGLLIKVLECPLYVDVRIPENKALLIEERKKNQIQIDLNATEVWRNINNCKNKNNDDWR